VGRAEVEVREEAHDGRPHHVHQVDRQHPEPHRQVPDVNIIITIIIIIVIMIMIMMIMIMMIMIMIIMIIITVASIVVVITSYHRHQYWHMPPSTTQPRLL
jgi:Flp pilus assembly protein TadB